MGQGSKLLGFNMISIVMCTICFFFFLLPLLFLIFVINDREIYILDFGFLNYFDL